MDLKGSSFGERDSGNEQNKASLNLLDGAADTDSNGAQNLSLYSGVQGETTTCMDGHVPASGVEECVSPGHAHQLSSTLADTIMSRHLKPLLEIGNGLSRSCYNSYNQDVRIGDETKQPSGATCLNMSLGLYNMKDAEEDCNNLSMMNVPGMVGNSFEVYSEAERNSLKFSVMNPIRTKSRQLLPRQPQIQQQCFPDASNSTSLSRPVTPKETAPMSIRVARPPVEGRGRNQLLPRYWPRITDQELQQITAGDSNSTIIPLFEKMLSASDAGRIGRLVLPKACAETYFPPISQPEGLPLQIQDISGKEWVFQFRFWPNNNSRMYVLEGVTTCIQSMQLQAGDTVTFSRLDPGGKLVMGYRRAPTSLSSQEAPPSIAAPPTAGPSSSIMGMGNANMDSFSSIANITDLLLQSTKASEVQVNGGTHGHLSLSDTGYGWYRPDKVACKAKEGSFFPSLPANDKKKCRLGSSKTRRPYTDMDEVAQFRLSWEEAQDLLRSPPNVIPSIITIEGFDFEEYDEPPVFGKRTIFTAKECGPGEDQWAQCDDCGSWRKVPSDVFLPTKWVCRDNVWDNDRNFCNAPQEVDNEEIEFLVQHLKEVSKLEPVEPFKGNEPSVTGLEALANAATGVENNVASSSSPAAATTKHPRHRPGCTCIVCIQPPSGKGPKHKPTCSCNVCMTVKRRFKTLMMRRKKRQSEREAEHAARKKRPWIKEDGDTNGSGKWHNDGFMLSESVAHQGSLVLGFPNALPRADSFPNMNRFFPNLGLPTLQYPPRGRSLVEDKAHIDLNVQPERDEEANRSAFRVSMVRLLQSATHPLETYLKEQGLISLVAPQQMTQSTLGFSRLNIERESDIHSSYSQTSAMANTEKNQDEPRITLGLPRFDTPTD